MIEIFYERLYVDQGLPWFLQLKDKNGKLISEHKASAVLIDVPSRTVFLPDNPGGKRGFVRADGRMEWTGTVVRIVPKT